MKLIIEHDEDYVMPADNKHNMKVWGKIRKCVNEILSWDSDLVNNGFNGQSACYASEQIPEWAEEIKKLCKEFKY